MKQEELSYYGQTIKEGIGLGHIVLGVSTSRDVFHVVRNQYKLVKHRQVAEIRDEGHGVSFYYKEDDQNETISSIVVRQPCSGTASGGITIGKHTMQDVVDEYGAPKWTTTDDSNTWWSDYPGIEFHVEREPSLRHYPLDEAIHLKKRISTILIKERIPGILNPSVRAQIPRVFVSYRWESPEHVKWVWRFVQDLLRRRIDVMYDRYHFLSRSDRPDPHGAAVLVKKMAACHVFMPILTPKYMERIKDCFSPLKLFTVRADMGGYGVRDGGIEDGWVFDEFQQYILQAKSRANMPCAAIAREGEPEEFIRLFGKDKVTDFRDSAEYKYAIDYHQTLDGIASLTRQYAVTQPLGGAEDVLFALDAYFRR